MKDLFLSILKEEEEYFPETGVKIEKVPGGLKRISIRGSNTSVIVPEKEIGKGGLNNELKRKIGERSGGEFEPEQANLILQTLSNRKEEKEKKERQDPFQKSYGDKK